MPREAIPIWFRQEQSRGRTPARGSALSREQIVASAIAIADAEGAEAVTMRRVATELGSGAMSLYRHVSTKDDLLDLMIDTVMADAAARLHERAEQPVEDLRAALREFAREQRSMLHRHPWLSRLMNTRPNLGPNIVATVDGALAIFDGLDLSPDLTMSAVNVIGAFVSGFVSRELGEIEARRRTGISEAEWREHMAPYVFRLLADGRNPRVARYVHEGDDEFEMNLDRQFDAQLDYVLDGIMARVAHPGGT